jgi:transcriptional regulator with XRE-family HTH domain
VVGMMTTTLGEMVRLRREEMGLSQAELSARMDAAVTPQQIHNIETGKTKIPAPHTMGPLARALRVPEEELLRAAGYLQCEPEYRETAVEAIERIGGIPTVEARMQALARLDPETYATISTLFQEWLAGLVQAQGALRPGPGVHPQDSKHKPRNGHRGQGG